MSFETCHFLGTIFFREKVKVRINQKIIIKLKLAEIEGAYKTASSKKTQKRDWEAKLLANK